MFTRRIGETLTIGDDIEVAILDIKGNQVSIGITAPEDVCILREELSDYGLQSLASKNSFDVRDIDFCIIVL